LKRLFGWIVHRLGPGTLLALTLLLVALSSVALGLVGVVRGLDAGLVLPVVALGMLAGWGLARLPLPGWVAGILAYGLGVEVVLLRVGRLGGKVVALVQTLTSLAWAIWRWPLDGPPDGKPVLLALAGLWTDLSTLVVRLYNWLHALAGGESAFDPVAVALAWSLVLWAVVTWAGWSVRQRDRPLQGIAPAIALLAASLAYVGGKPDVLLPPLGATLLLMVLTGHAARERRWQASGIDFSVDIRLDLALAVIPLALVLVSTAWLVPSVSWRQAVEWVQRLTEVRVGRTGPFASSLGLEPQPGPATVFDALRATGLPRSHLIGAGPELSRQVVMVITTGDLPPGPPESMIGRSPPRYYWRGLTYDYYTGRGWLTGETETTEYQAGEPALTATPPTHRTVRQQVRAVGNLGGLLYATGVLVMADQDYSVAWRFPGDAFGATISAPTYQAVSLVPLVSAPQLRAAGSDYPEAVRNRYLALPDQVPSRVLGLARDLTATAATPYDRAHAIETYLRTLPYTLALPAPPSERDLADYFLFDLKKGYCDYYATAMVVLARAAGLPARLVVGYAGGTYDAPTARYVVTEADAHAWVEIYFPGYGWIEFEPTGAYPPIERPAETIPHAESSSQQSVVSSQMSGYWLLATVYWLLPSAFCLLALAGVAWSVADGWRLRRLPPAVTVATLYQRLYRHGQRLAVPVQAGDTPYEFAASLARRVADLAQARRWGPVLAPAAQEASWLTDLCVQALYSPHPPDAADQVQAIQAWRRLRWRLWLAWLWQKG
jgi:transglutaminase-like putative cysteine protease